MLTRRVSAIVEPTIATAISAYSCDFVRTFTLPHPYLTPGRERPYHEGMATENGINTTYPYETTSPGVARNQCAECGAWERSDKAGGQLKHSKRCDSRPQPACAIAAQTVRAAEARRSDLEKFARQVRKTGMTSGRDQDVRDAVAAGLLSESDAMNTDD